MISFKTTKDEGDMIDLIVQRANVKNSFELLMDITACHVNACPLNLGELYAAKDSDFYHDLIGIVSHINRTTGKLEDCFVPRYARRAE